MKCVLRNLSICLLAFFIGVAVPSVWLTFTPTFYASGISSSGGGYGTTSYKSSDGYELAEACGAHGTSQLAQQALQEVLSNAAGVIERQPKLDTQGRQVGERVVARVNTENMDEGIAVVLWTDKDRLCHVAGKSMRHVLALEKKIVNK